MKRNTIRLTENLLRNIVRESVRKVINEDGISSVHRNKKNTFIRNLNNGCFDENLYQNKESIMNMAKSCIHPDLLEKVFIAIDNRYNQLHKKYPDGMPVLSDEQREQRKRAKKQMKNIQKGIWDYQLFMDGEKFVKWITRKYPDFPQVAEEAEKRRKWVDKTYSFDNMPRDIMYTR